MTLFAYLQCTDLCILVSRGNSVSVNLAGCMFWSVGGNQSTRKKTTKTGPGPGDSTFLLLSYIHPLCPKINKSENILISDFYFQTSILMLTKTSSLYFY